MVRAEDGGRHFIARYAPLPVTLPRGNWTELLLANADDSPPILRNDAEETPATLELRDARGRLLRRDAIVPPPGLSTLDVGSDGLARLRRTPPAAPGE